MLKKQIFINPCGNREDWGHGGLGVIVVAHTWAGDDMGEHVAESSRNTIVVLEGPAMELLEFVKMRMRY